MLGTLKDSKIGSILGYMSKACKELICKESDEPGLARVINYLHFKAAFMINREAFWFLHALFLSEISSSYVSLESLSFLQKVDASEDFTHIPLGKFSRSNVFLKVFIQVSTNSISS